MTGSFWHVSGYKDSASRAQKQTKFAVLPRRRLSKRRLVLRKVVQAECKSKLVYGFAEARFRESGRQFVPGKDTNESIKALFLLREISDCSSACSTPCQTCGRLSRAGYILFGWAMLVLGVVGIFVPLLPTTPFLLLAAWAFCRSSPRLYDRLLAHPCLGAYVRNFREYRAIPLHAKIISVTLIWATLLYCIFGVVRAWWWAQAGLLLLAVGLTWHILSYATLRRPE